jgi:hypothetical protein
MKAHKFLPILILFFGFTASLKAQQVNYRNEKVFLNNQLYGYLIKKGSVWAKDYSFQTTKNEEIATIKAINREMTNGHDYVYYEVAFKGYAQKGEMDLNPSFDRQLAIEMAVYSILKNDVLNPEGVEKFLVRYPAIISKRLDGKLIKNEPKTSAVTPAVEPVAKPAEVAVKAEVKPEVKTEIAPVRETEKVASKNEPTVVVVAVPVPMSAYSNAEAKATPVPAVTAPAPVVEPAPVAAPAKITSPLVPGLKIAGTSILKGAKKVGRFAVNEQAVNNNLKKSYGFYNVKNLKVASATFTNTESTACKIYTPKDKKTRTVNIANNGEALKALSGWLVQNRYL